MSKPDKDTEASIDKAVESIDEAEMQAIDEPSETEEIASEADDATAAPVSEKKTKKRFSVSKKKVLISAAVAALLVGVVAAVPFLRYGAVGAVYAKPVELRIVDSVTKKPVTGASVSLGRETSVSDKSGIAKFTRVPVGDHYLSIEKKYYETNKSSVLVPIFSDVRDTTRTLKATGRTISVSVTHALSGMTLAGVDVKIGDATAATDSTGTAQVVVGINAGTLNGAATSDGFNTAVFTVDTKKNDDQAITVKLVPTGSLYFLSKATGTINLMKANLDGSGAMVAVQGTGKEYDRDTMIIASTDWRYIMLQANRDGKTKLYAVNTKDNSLVPIDDENATYVPAGWFGHKFVYQVSRSVSSWQPGQLAIKLYDAETRTVTKVDETQASGSNYYDYTAQYLSPPIINDGRIEYAKYWSASYTGALDGKKSQIITADERGITRVMKEFDASQSPNYLVADSPTTAYASVYDAAKSDSVVYRIAGGKVSPASISIDALNNSGFPVYQRSANGTKTAWHESRDGKYVVFVGDGDGKSGKQIESAAGYRVYGWLSDEYLLLTKNNSELYIYSIDGQMKEPLKVTDYHRPDMQWAGLGYGGVY